MESNQGRRHRPSLTSKGGVEMRPEDTDMEQPTTDAVDEVVEDETVESV